MPHRRNAFIELMNEICVLKPGIVLVHDACLSIHGVAFPDARELHYGGNGSSCNSDGLLRALLLHLWPGSMRALSGESLILQSCTRH